MKNSPTRPIFVVVILFVLSLFAIPSAKATPVLTFDNRSISTSGFGQVQGYYGSWYQSATAPSYSSFNSQLRAGVNFSPLPDPPYGSDYFTLLTYVDQNSTVIPTEFAGSGIAGMATEAENATLGAAGEMHVQSIFDIGFNLLDSYKADLDASLTLLSVPSWTVSNAITSGHAIVSLVKTDTMTSMFNYSYDYMNDIYEELITDSAILSPGAYELIIGVSNNISYTGYADFGLGDNMGFGSYTFDMNLTAVPEPKTLILVGLGLVVLRLLHRRKLNRKSFSTGMDNS